MAGMDPGGRSRIAQTAANRKGGEIHGGNHAFRRHKKRGSLEDFMLLTPLLVIQVGGEWVQ